MPSEALDKTIITDIWQFFLKKLFQHFIHHKKILKATKFQFKIICRSRVLNKNIPLWSIVLSPPPPGANRVNTSFSFKIKEMSMSQNYKCLTLCNHLVPKKKKKKMNKQNKKIVPSPEVVKMLFNRQTIQKRIKDHLH